MSKRGFGRLPVGTAAALAAAVLVAGMVLLRTDSTYYSTLPPVVRDVSVSEDLREDYTVTLTATVEPPGEMRPYDDYAMWVCLSEDSAAPAPDSPLWQPVQQDTVSFDVHAGDYHLYTKDTFGNVGSSEAQAVEINAVVDIRLPVDSLVLAAQGGYATLEPVLLTLGTADETIRWSCDNPAVATVDETGLVTAGGTPGTAIITATTENGLTATAEVVTTDYITLPQINNAKQKLGYNISFTEEEAAMLDDALFGRVEQAGWETRAGVVAAARFLALEFAYRVPYFYENGRTHLDEYTRHYCDGEGRYYHRGLYLTPSKYDGLDPEGIRYGPAHWGAPLTNWEDAADKGFAPGQRYPNGLDCSGFVTWCLINGGIDVGDVGAGDYVFRDDELCDLGQREYITLELMQSGRVKAGDLIGKDGHIAIIIGLDEENIYIAESLYSGVVVATKTKYSSLLYAFLYDYIMLMDDEYAAYEGEGNYTAMWQ